MKREHWWRVNGLAAAVGVLVLWYVVEAAVALPWPLLLLDGLAASVVLGYVVRRVSPFGPLFFYETLRASRRRQLFLLRGAYGLLLLFQLFFVFASWFAAQGVEFSVAGAAIGSHELNRFAERFFSAFLAAQAAAVLLLTPACTAGAVAEEKQRRTLSELLTTPLTAPEIVLGKLAARLAQMGLLLLTAVPVLFITLALGGIDPVLVVAGFAGTAVLLLSVASLGLACSVRCDRPFDAILQTYFAVGALLILLLLPGLDAAHPFVAWGKLLEARTSGGGVASVFVWFLLFHVVGSVCLCTWAVLSLRERAEPRPRRGRRAAAPTPTPDEPVARKRRVYYARRPPVGNHPLLWKELHGEHKLSWHGPDPVATATAAAFAAVSIGGWPAFWVFQAFAYNYSLMDNMNLWVRLMGVVFGGLTFLGVALFAVGAVSREREQRTLDSLRLIPRSDEAILAAKWLGAVGSVRLVGWVLGFVWTVGLLTGGLHPLGLLGLLAAWLVTAGFLASLGVWWSVRSTSYLQANLRMLVSLLGLLVFAALLRAPDEVLRYWLPDWFHPTLAALQATHLFPLEWVFDFSFSIRGSRWETGFGFGKWAPNFTEDLLGMTVYAVLAVLLGFGALRRFVAEKGKPPRGPMIPSEFNQAPPENRSSGIREGEAPAEPQTVTPRTT